MKIERVSMELIKPSSPTPSHLQDFKLSFIDEMIPNSYIPLILYYSSSEDKHIYNHSKISHRLKKSLSETLVKFYPLARRMKGQSLVDCSDDGVSYIEAKVGGELSDMIKHPEAGFLDNLLPHKSNGIVSNVKEQLAIQVNLFSCGGIAIGICISHRIADFCTLSSFIKSWSNFSMTSYGNISYNNLVCPVFNSSSLFPPRNTPDFKPNSKSPSVMSPVRVKLVTKRVVFTASAIDAMKQEVKEKSLVPKATRVEVITAFLWKQCLLAKGVEKSSKSVAFHPVSLRLRISQLEEHSFGNLFQMMSAVSVGESDWIEMVEKLRDALGEMERNHIQKLIGEKGFEFSKENFRQIGRLMAVNENNKNVEVLRFSSYCRFSGVYESDFGLGRPVWVSSSGSYGSKDTIFLFDSVQSVGGIEAWITMADKDMERLQMGLPHFLLVN